MDYGWGYYQLRIAVGVYVDDIITSDMFLIYAFKYGKVYHALYYVYLHVNIEKAKVNISKEKATRISLEIRITTVYSKIPL